jgi:IMP dehydrogenase
MDIIAMAEKSNRPITVIADGGIKNSGDIVKALAAGADAVMVGNLLSGCEECPGKKYKEGSGLYKIYRGMSSRSAQEDWKGYATSIEGEMKRVPYKGSVRDVFKELIAGILSGFSYQNARTLNELYKNAVFIRQTPNGLRESLPHALL